MATYSPEITKLISEGSKEYASKEYELAAEKYAEACETYSTETNDNDADLLLLYGKALFQVAVTKSEVFGGNANEEDNQDNVANKNGKDDDKSQLFQFSEDAPLAEQEDDELQENVSESDEEQGQDEDEPKQEEEEEEESDFEVAWEILDLARTLFESSLEKLTSASKEKLSTEPLLKSEDEETTDPITILKKKLSETYDLLGEVSLEAENFQQSAVDLESALELRKELYPTYSSLISESYYKLSLALEFCVEDETSRSRAVEQMELAIESVKKRGEITNKKDPELIQDLEVRLQELKKDPTEELEEQKMNIIKGILGEPTSQSEGSSQPAAPSSQSAPAVRDLTSMVKKRKAAPNKLVAKKAKQ